MKKILILRGLPASGKSSFARDLMKREPNWKRINRDELRALIDDSVWTPQNEELIVKIQTGILRTLLRNNCNIICDDCNLSQKSFDRFCEIAMEFGDVLIEEKVFDVSVKECIKRDSLREGIACVGAQVIMDMYERYNLKDGYPKPRSKYIGDIKTKDVL